MALYMGLSWFIPMVRHYGMVLEWYSPVTIQKDVDNPPFVDHFPSKTMGFPPL
jgi:hypothetical protein